MNRNYSFFLSNTLQIEVSGDRVAIIKYFPIQTHLTNNIYYDRLSYFQDGETLIVMDSNSIQSDNLERDKIINDCFLLILATLSM